MKNRSLVPLLALAGALSIALAIPSQAQQTPPLLSYQGRVLSGGNVFTGNGGFKFALVNAAGTVTYWSNDGTSSGGSEPLDKVPLTVTSGLYSVQLGDTTLPHMTASIPASAFSNGDARLRIWFDDGTHGSQLLTPDQRISAVPYATVSGTAALAGGVTAGGVTSSMIAAGAVGSAQLAAGAVQNSHLADATISVQKLATPSLTVTAGTGLGGGGAVSLGATVTLSNAGVLSLGGGGGITVSATTGAINLGSNATSANTSGTLVQRDGGGSFSAGTLSLGGALSLPATTASTAGVITIGGTAFLHSFGSQNTFLGSPSGNFTMTGNGNTAIGAGAFVSNMGGSGNTAIGRAALAANTTGGANTGYGDGVLSANSVGYDNTATGYQALNANTSGFTNTADGYQALSQNTIGGDNLSSGFRALYSNTAGSRNVAVGVSALATQSFNNSGAAWNGYDVAVGYQALFSNQPTDPTNGINNTAVGANALYSNTTGTNNTAQGSTALMGNLTGSNNTAVGFEALLSNTTGDENTAMGQDALLTNTAGYYNVALGKAALRANVSGHQNTSVGYGALNGNTSGSFNVAVGQSAGVNLTTGSNNIDVANSGLAGESGIIRIGTSGTQTATYVAGIFGASVSGNTVVVNSNGQLGLTGSSERFKERIAPMGAGSEVLYDLQPVSFRYKREIDPDATPQFGLIAEEVAKVDSSLVVRDGQGKIFTVRYDAVNAMLLNEFLKEHRRAEQEHRHVEDQESALAEQHRQIQALKTRLTELETLVRKTTPPPGPESLSGSGGPGDRSNSDN